MRKQSTSLHGAAAAASAAAAGAASSSGGTVAGGVGVGTTSRFRTKKLNPRQNLKILRAWELDENTLLDISATVGEDSISGTKDSSLNTSLPRVESGVEHKEEKEHHLQAVISATRAEALGRKVANASTHIPTPDVGPSDVHYEKLFPKAFNQPATYIRFSSTVEDSNGVPYCMSSEDEAVLKDINSKHVAAPGDPAECTEDWFEQLMSAYEQTSLERQPFAAVDNPPVLSLDEMESAFDETVEDGARTFAKEVYEYWEAERLKRGNRSIMAKLKTLKMDSGQDADDSDPYVCFRRREVRQARKTRGRDAQVVEKLKKLRRELEEGRNLLDLVRQRELGKRDDLNLSKEIFEQRTAVREMKRSLDIKDDEDELLINQKKRRIQEQPSQQPLRPGPPNRIAPITEGRLPGQDGEFIDLRMLLARREREISTHIDSSVAAHERWNKHVFDETQAVLHGLKSPRDVFLRPEDRQDSSFVGLKFEYTQQPTPPETVAADSPAEDEEDPEADAFIRDVPVDLAKPQEFGSFEKTPRYRSRRGRGGRLMFDKHNARGRPKDDVDDVLLDRFKFDYDSGDEHESDDVDLESSEAFSMRTQWAVRDAQAVQAAHRRASAEGRDMPAANSLSASVR
ncbi:MAG: Enhancer of polycomb-like protein 1 [Alyxoria varia]|nr:MAG: Enhancer of polycomb-like protein 1 [Alyxoria varia]